MIDEDKLTYNFKNGSSITVLPSESNVSGKRKELVMQQIFRYWCKHPVELIEYFYNCKLRWYEKALLRLECKWTYLKKLLRG